MVRQLIHSVKNPLDTREVLCEYCVHGHSKLIYHGFNLHRGRELHSVPACPPTGASDLDRGQRTMTIAIVFSALLIIDTVLYLVMRKHNRWRARERVNARIRAKIDRYLSENPEERL